MSSLYSQQQQRQFAIQEEILAGLTREQQRRFRQHTETIFIPEDQHSSYGPASRISIRQQAATLRQRFLSAIGQSSSEDHYLSNMDPPDHPNEEQTTNSATTPPIVTDNMALHVIMQSLQQLLQQQQTSSHGTHSRPSDELGRY